MKRTKTSIKRILLNAILLTTLAWGTACEDESNTVEPSLNKSTYSDYESDLLGNLRHFSQQLSTSTSGDIDKDFLKTVSSTRFGGNSDDHKVFVQAIDQPAAATSLTGALKQKVENIQSSIASHSSVTSYVAFLNDQFDQVLADESMDLNDKDFLLTHISTTKVVTQVIDEYQDIFSPIVNSGRVASWWGDWGKCAAGIVGGIGTGAMTGGYAGAAGGTVVLPGVGTVGGGLFGGICGGLFGGITGAAASC